MLDEVNSNCRARSGRAPRRCCKDGLRLNPEFAERIFLTGGIEPRSSEFSQAFQAVGAPPERVAFKYALFDQGSGREFQSEPILNIAGLGSPDGKRPFRYFARPIEFAPRSIIRMQITEVSAFQGELHISLQGYKTLGATGHADWRRDCSAPEDPVDERRDRQRPAAARRDARVDSLSELRPAARLRTF